MLISVSETLSISEGVISKLIEGDVLVVIAITATVGVGKMPNVVAVSNHHNYNN